MSRSRRKTPIHGITTATSEKEDKKLMNRTLRSKHKQQIHTALTQDELDELILMNKDDAMNVWDMSKDGKMYYFTDEEEFYRK